MISNKEKEWQRMYAIKLSHVHKVYQIYDKPTQRIKDALFNTKSYREYHALNDLSVEIPKGEAVGVLGKNGAGKSTLLKIITGVVTPTSGSVEIDGRISAILELNSGFDEELNGYENIFIKGAILGFSKKEIEDPLDTLNYAFEKLLDDLFRDTAWDVSSDVTVLENMLAQEGLTKKKL